MKGTKLSAIILEQAIRRAASTIEAIQKANAAMPQAVDTVVKHGTDGPLHQAIPNPLDKRPLESS